MPPILLSDAVLITFLKENVEQLGYGTLSNKAKGKTYQEQLKATLQQIEEDKSFRAESFSLLKFSAHSRRAEEQDLLFELWRLGTIGALHVLKWHDRRENFDRTGKQRVTPPVIDELVEYYKKLRKYEPLLYGSDQYYRDHFAHVLRVWILGLLVILPLKDSDKLVPPLLTEDKNLDHRAFKPQEIVAMFTLAALTHDMGYPLEKFVKLNEAVADLLSTFGAVEWQQLSVAFSMPQHETAQDLLRQIASKPQYRRLADNAHLAPDEVQRNVEDLLGKYETPRSSGSLREFHEHLDWGIVLRCQWKYFQKYASSLEKNHHGFISALLLQRKVLYFREGEFSLEEDHNFVLEEARQFMIRRDILRAIASHSCPDIYFLSPLSTEALLFFCDEIQDWGRPYFSEFYLGDGAVDGVKVTLKSFTFGKVAWVVNMKKTTLPGFVARALSTATSLYARLRGAVNSRSRAFNVSWVLSSLDKPLEAKFEFHNPKAGKPHFAFTIKERRTGKSHNLMGIVEEIPTGIMSFQEARQKVEKRLEPLL